MAYYRNSYVPAFTSNDTYGNFYDASKVSLITVPDRLKNYVFEVRKAGMPTSAAEYGEFLRRDGLYRAPAGFSRLREQQEELQQTRFAQQKDIDDRFAPPLPPPQPQPLPRHLPPLQHHPSYLPDEYSPPASPEPSDPPTRRQAAERPDSVRGPPPPASLDRYRGGAAAAAAPPPAPPPPPPPLQQRPLLQQQQPPPPQPSSPYPYRISRSRSPPPPPDVVAYKSNPGVYTGRGPAAVPRQQLEEQRQALLSSQPLAPQQPLEPQLPPVRLGQREVHLPSIEAVEVRMRDNSRVMLDVHDFYRRYLRD